MTDESKKILIVEDEAPLADVLSDRLSSEGFNVVVARDGEEGLAAAVSQQPDLILLDILLPKKSGLAVLQELRATEEGKHIAVMMLTNLDEIEDVNVALANGAYDYIVKSDWNLTDLIANVRNKLNIQAS